MWREFEKLKPGEGSPMGVFAPVKKISAPETFSLLNEVETMNLVLLFRCFIFGENQDS